MSFETEFRKTTSRAGRGIALALAIVSAPACLDAGHVATSATETDGGSTGTTTTTAGATDGVSSTSVGSSTTTTTSSTSASTATGDESTTGCTFLCTKEDGGGAGSIACDVWAQDCPEGQKCMPWA